jgi:predicted permease
MWPWRSRRFRDDDKLDRELRDHIELEAEEHEADGISAQDAHYAALRAFGNTTLVKEQVREMWSLTAVDQFLQDVRYALRGGSRAPGFALVAVLSLTLGIGATTAVFSVLSAVALQPLPVRDPESLVILKPELRGKRFVLFNPLFEELRNSTQALSGVFAVNDERFLKAAFDGEAPAFVRGSLVSGNYFEMLGLTPAIGRLLTSADDEPSAQTCAAVLSHRFWTTAHRGAPDVLGRKIIVRERECLVVGVAPEGFRGHDSVYAPDLWVPLRPLNDPKLLASRSMAFFSGVIGRLKPGVSIAQAEAELTTRYQRMQPPNEASPHPGEPPTNPADFRMKLAPGAQGLDTAQQRLGQPLRLALAVTGIVLLIACVNVANLLLARGTARTTELATRAALGAGRARLVRLLAIEGAVLAIAGGLAGFLLAWLFTPALAKVISLPDGMGLNIRPDTRVLGIAAAATMIAALFAGILPAFRLSGAHLQAGMSAAARVTAQRSGQRVVRTLVVAQLALSLLLLTSAGLLLRSMLHVMAVDPGFDSSHVVMMDVRDTQPGAKFGEVDGPEQKAQRAALYRTLDERLNALPGVRAASLSWLGLFGGSYVGLNTYDVEHPEDRRFTLVDYITPRYFDAVGMRLKRGRAITGADREGSLRIAVVNQAFVRERLGGAEAIGRRFVMTYADDLRPFTIVGIVADAKYNDLRERQSEPMMWVPLAQVPVKLSSVSLRVQPGAEAAIVREASAVLKATSAHLMVRKTTTLTQQVAQATTRERMLLRLASGFGALAILLAAVGLYGTLAYAVTRRTREIGVRLALGAQRGSVMRLVIGESLAIVSAALVAGIPLSLGAGYLLRGFLFDVAAHDTAALAGSSVALSVISVLAAFVPAHRASRVDPMRALKYE